MGAGYREAPHMGAGFVGEAAATQTSPIQSGPKGPLRLKKINVWEAVLVHVTVVLVCVVNIFAQHGHEK